jgi:hypothetical protein
MLCPNAIRERSRGDAASETRQSRHDTRLFGRHDSPVATCRRCGLSGGDVEDAGYTVSLGLILPPALL